VTGAVVKATGLVPDANVVIDYVESDVRILLLMAAHIAPIHIPSPVLDEVAQLPQQKAEGLGLHVVEPTLAQATEAAAGTGQISFQDRLCLVTARDNGWHCVTNDRALRRACAGAGVEVMWGIEAMRPLVAVGRLSPSRALAVAERIARMNPYITEAIIRRFRSQIGM
jgi:rRNA-processing protein FCF1